jgi:hypothetical protein
MTLPAFLFAVIVSSFYGAAFHFWRGGGLGQLLLFLILGWLGFWVGHAIANGTGWQLMRVGALNLGVGSLASAFFLFVGNWLAHIEVAEDEA